MPVQSLQRQALPTTALVSESPQPRARLVDVDGVRFAGCRVLIAPGLFGSGPEHWQSAWQRQYPRFARVDQDDWSLPNLERWARRVVESAIDADEPVIVVAHSFGCLATVRAASFQSSLIAGALLVAPADPARFGVEAQLPQQTLEFPTTLVASTDDPWMPLDKAQRWAERWGSSLVKLDAAGHINVKSGYTEWPTGLELLERLCVDVRSVSRRSAGSLQLLH
jgi:predicted alpha/beta hydrolase family esterase